MTGSNGSTSKFKVARPAIAIEGQDQSSLSEGLVSLSIIETTQGLYRSEAKFTNWGAKGNRIGFLHFDRRTLDFGKKLTIKLGTNSIFQGRIMGLEAHFPEGRAPELNVLAEDRFQDLRMTRRTRSFVDVKDADVIRQIATEHGLSPSIEISGPKHRLLAQINQSDLAFLRDRARAVDAELWMDGQTLSAKSHVNRGGAPLTITYGNELREFSVLADLANQRTSVTVSGWNVTAKESIKQAVTDTVLRNELNGDRSGASILAAVLGQRKEVLAHTVPLSGEAARVEAETYFKLIARRFVVGRGVADADSRLRAGNYVDLQGLGEMFSGKYYLSEVRHRFDSLQGIRTEFTAERPGLGAAA